MKRIFASILIIAYVASALAIFWHATAMASSAMDNDGMSPACLTVCLTHGDLSAATSAVVIAVACFILLFFFLEFFIGPIGPIRPINTAQKDRHRYLMKTIVMLR